MNRLETGQYIDESTIVAAERVGKTYSTYLRMQKKEEKRGTGLIFKIARIVQKQRVDTAVKQLTRVYYVTHEIPYEVMTVVAEEQRRPDDYVGAVSNQYVLWCMQQEANPNATQRRSFREIASHEGLSRILKTNIEKLVVAQYSNAREKEGKK